MTEETKPTLTTMLGIIEEKVGKERYKVIIEETTFDNPVDELKAISMVYRTIMSMEAEKAQESANNA